MNVTVKLFAAAREAVGAAEIVVALPTGAAVAELRTALGEQWPKLAPLLASSLVAVNAQYAPPSAQLEATDEVALIPPVSGG